MRSIIIVLMFCVVGCSESHMPFDGDASVLPMEDGGVGNDSDIIMPDASDDGGVSPDGDVSDAGQDADSPTCGTLARDTATHLTVTETDCDGPMRRVQWVEVTPYSGSGPATHCQTVGVRIYTYCSSMPQTWERVGRWIRSGVVYTSEPFEFGCEGVTYMCSIVHDPVADTTSLSCSYEGLSCEANFAP